MGGSGQLSVGTEMGVSGVDSCSYSKEEVQEAAEKLLVWESKPEITGSSGSMRLPTYEMSQVARLLSDIGARRSEKQDECKTADSSCFYYGFIWDICGAGKFYTPNRKRR